MRLPAFPDFPLPAPPHGVSRIRLQEKFFSQFPPSRCGCGASAMGSVRRSGSSCRFLACIFHLAHLVVVYCTLGVYEVLVSTWYLRPTQDLHTQHGAEKHEARQSDIKCTLMPVCTSRSTGSRPKYWKCSCAPAFFRVRFDK